MPALLGFFVNPGKVVVEQKLEFLQPFVVPFFFQGLLVLDFLLLLFLGDVEGNEYSWFSLMVCLLRQKLPSVLLLLLPKYLTQM